MIYRDSKIAELSYENSEPNPPVHLLFFLRNLVICSSVQSA